MNSELILEDIVAFVPSWKSLKPEDIHLKRLVGITNKVLGVSHLSNDITPTVLIYRLFGSAQENPYLNRAVENRVFQEIGKAGVGPHIYGFTDRYRLEEFIPSSVLPAKCMLDEEILLKIASKLKKFHSIDASFLPKESKFAKLCKEENPFAKAYAKMNRPELFSEEELKKVEEFRKWLHPDELKWVSEQLLKLDNELVLSHNDMLANNILLRNEGKKVEFIDFEYTAYNYRAYDIANYFNESLFDYEVQTPPYFTCVPGMPSFPHIRRFLQYYVLSDKVTAQELLQHIGQDKELSELVTANNAQAEFDSLMGDIPLCLMLSDFYWGSWAISVSKNPQINFDYIRFARIRLQQYQEVKNAYFKQK